MKGNTDVPIYEKVLLTIPEAAAYSNIGVGKLRELTGCPKCTFVLHIGNRRLIKRKAFEIFIDDRIEI